MLAFYAGAGTGDQLGLLAGHGREILDICEYGFPSWDPRHEAFECRRYWRGPVWSVMNYMIAIGLEGSLLLFKLSPHVVKSTAFGGCLTGQSRFISSRLACRTILLHRVLETFYLTF